MSRKNRNKNRRANKKYNKTHEERKRRFEAKNTTTVAEFLKRDGDVALVNVDGTKFRIHKAHIFGNINWIQKGSIISVRETYLIPVYTKRIVLSNLKSFLSANKVEVQPNSSESYTYGEQVKVVSSQSDSTRLGLPIGTQYHWITYDECPRQGDFVMGMVTGKYKNVIGFVEKVNEASRLCVIDKEVVPIEAIGYKIMNPEFLLSQSKKDLRTTKA